MCILSRSLTTLLACRLLYQGMKQWSHLADITHLANGKVSIYIHFTTWHWLSYWVVTDAKNCLKSLMLIKSPLISSAFTKRLFILILVRGIWGMVKIVNQYLKVLTRGAHSKQVTTESLRQQAIHGQEPCLVHGHVHTAELLADPWWTLSSRPLNKTWKEAKSKEGRGRQRGGGRVGQGRENWSHQ